MPIQHISSFFKRRSSHPPCSMGHKYMWCKDLIPSLKDKDDNNLCVFHAPKGKKGEISIEEFNALVFERMMLAHENERLCDLSGTIFEGTISFKNFFKDHPDSSFNFEDAVFFGDTDFSDADFTEEVNFSKVHFCGTVNFVGAHFRKSAPFNGAIFDEESFFSEATFSSKAHFFDTTFFKMAHFTKAIFYQELHLSIGCFKKGADFNNAKYYKRMIFKRPVGGVPKDH